MKTITNQPGNPYASYRSPRHMKWAVCLLFVWAACPTQGQGSATENLRLMGKTFATIAKEVSPAVVFIKVEKSVENQPDVQNFSPFGGDSPLGEDFFQHFFGMPFQQEQPRRSRQVPRPKQRMKGQGSGFIISSNGYIMTNNHVVGDADKVMVKLEDGREFSAKIVGTDPHSDVAVIKIDAENLPVLALGDSDVLEVGEWVLAIGNPFGLSHTLTAGIVSAKGRSSVGLADYENFIQTDAAINPGNSGGPLIDLNGKAIGMNTAIVSRSGGSMGIGFAIPINMARAIKDQLVQTGSVTRGYLGIVIQDLTPDLADSFALDEHKGILVAEVAEDSPAEKAGLKQGDVIVSFDGKTVGDVGTFRNRVSLKTPGTHEEITIFRDIKNCTFTVTIGELPGDDRVAGIESHTPNNLGLTVQALSSKLAKRFGYLSEQGVIVTEVAPRSVAAKAGIQIGTLIQEVNRQQIHNVEDLKQALHKNEDKHSVLLLIKTEKYSCYVVLNTEE
ncbi:MAG: DegQ family serine endoprotease [Desulfobacterales bacterium]|nr:DegQ family serine endoprotease [Desulfobacterales bacterium]